MSAEQCWHPFARPAQPNCTVLSDVSTAQHIFILLGTANICAGLTALSF